MRACSAPRLPVYLSRPPSQRSGLATSSPNYLPREKDADWHEAFRPLPDEERAESMDRSNNEVKNANIIGMDNGNTGSSGEEENKQHCMTLTGEPRFATLTSMIKSKIMIRFLFPE